jgi:CarD family transcriptional regulator
MGGVHTIIWVNDVAVVHMTAAMVTAALKATASQTKPKDMETFEMGDDVVYPAHGVGRVDKVGFEDIAGYRLNLIHISFEDNRMTLRVPVAQARATGLRQLVDRKVMAEALATLKTRPRGSRFIWSKRSQECLTKINTGNPRMLAEVVRDLQPAADGSGNSTSRRDLFELALGRLAAEFAAVNRIQKAQAVEQISQALLEARAASRTEDTSTRINA